MTTTLTPRQLQIAELLQQGKKTQEISEVMGLPRKTIRHYLHLAYKRTGVSSVQELTMKITAEGLDDLKPGKIPKSTPDRRKLMTRIRWRDGDNCCVCGELIDFRIKSNHDPQKPSFYYELRSSVESSVKLAHGQCNPLVGAAGEKSKTVDEV
jgi:DNA-binding CsgD family transcriptional regulator